MDPDKAGNLCGIAHIAAHLYDEDSENEGDEYVEQARWGGHQRGQSPGRPILLQSCSSARLHFCHTACAYYIRCGETWICGGLIWSQMGFFPLKKWSWFLVDNKCCTCHLTIKKWVGGQSASQLFNLRLKLFNYSRDCFYRALQREADARRSNGVGSAAAKSEGAESYYTTRNISRARGEPCSRYHYFILKQAIGCGLSLNTSFWVDAVAHI